MKSVYTYSNRYIFKFRIRINLFANLLFSLCFLHNGGPMSFWHYNSAWFHVVSTYSICKHNFTHHPCVKSPWLESYNRESSWRSFNTLNTNFIALYNDSRILNEALFSWYTFLKQLIFYLVAFLVNICICWLRI